jgi:CDP-diacylglycerol--serine O-phosphatidyltransferase
VRLEAIVVIALLGGALVSAPFETLSAVAIVYLLMIPLSVVSYSRVRRRRAASASGAPRR